MHTVVETPPFLNAAKAAGIPDSVRAGILSAVAANPTMGDLVVGAGGLRKFRFSRPGEGKSGGYRILSVYLGEHLPVFLIGAFAKNQKTNISTAERTEIAKRLKTMAETYRKPKEPR